MRIRIEMDVVWIISLPALLLFASGCAIAPRNGGDTNKDFDNASTAIGGALYDNWWKVIGAE